MNRRPISIPKKMRVFSCDLKICIQHLKLDLHLTTEEFLIL